MRYSTFLAAICLAATSLAQAPANPPAATTQVSAVDQAIASLHARGLPATFADLKQPPLPEDKNAVVDVLAAAKVIVGEKGGPRSSSLEYGDQLPYPPEWFRLAEENIAANGKVFDLMRLARNKGGIAWDDAPTSPFGDWIQKSYLNTFSRLRAIAISLGDAALYAHFKGDDAEAIKRVQDLTFLADAVNRRPFLIPKLVGIGIDSLGTNTIQVIASGLHVGDNKAAPRNAVKDVIAGLLNDDQLKDLYRRALAEERTIMIEQARSDWSGPAALAYSELLQNITAYDAMIAAIDKPTWDQPQITGGALLNTIVPTIERLRQTIWREITLRHMAAVSLAAAAYRNDHNSYPATLKDLVPDYLPAVPADPYSRTGEPLFYRLAENGRRPLVGSLGPDGREAADAPLPPEARYSLHHAEPGEPDDIWLDLSAWNPSGGK